MKYLLPLILVACTTQPLTKLYQCRDADTVDYIEALDIDDAIQHFKLAHPEFDKYACKYVDDTSQIGKGRKQ